jgi:hypothetical protein
LGKRFYFGLDLGQIIADLPWLHFKGFAVRYTGGFDTERLGLDFSGGFFRHSLLESELGETPFYNDGGAGFYFRIAAPLHMGDLILEPSFLYAQAQWETGSFYWFFGKPHIPEAWKIGISALYREQHRLSVNYLTLDLNLLNNDDLALFDSRSEGITASYAFSLQRTPIRLEGTLGWFSAWGSAEGALTAANQHYSLFPYNFYRVRGGLSAHAAYGLIHFSYYRKFFQYHIAAGAAHVFSGESEASIHYKKKRLFGSDEVMEDPALPALKGIGAAFLLLDAGLPSLSIGRGVHVSLGLRKLFLIPWGYDQFFRGDSGEGSAFTSGGRFSTELLRTVLLSGLSFYGKFFL